MSQACSFHSHDQGAKVFTARALARGLSVEPACQEDVENANHQTEHADYHGQDGGDSRNCGGCLRAHDSFGLN